MRCACIQHSPVLLEKGFGCGVLRVVLRPVSHRDSSVFAEWTLVPGIMEAHANEVDPASALRVMCVIHMVSDDTHNRGIVQNGAFLLVYWG